jgi:hypothetical protein
MPERMLNCAKCNAMMEPGFIPDTTYGGFLTPTWVAGPPVRSVWLGLRLKGKTRYPVATYRCPSCGYLESYAAVD